MRPEQTYFPSVSELTPYRYVPVGKGHGKLLVHQSDQGVVAVYGRRVVVIIENGEERLNFTAC